MNLEDHSMHILFILTFDNNPPMKELFSADMQIERIITGLEIYAGHKIDPDQTLLIFDEISGSSRSTLLL